MKKTLFLFAIILLFSCANDGLEQGQTQSEEKEELNAFTVESVNEYLAVYHFGESEMETDLIINGANGKYYAQIRSGSFNDDATQWIYHYENLGHVKIEGNKFYSDKTNGEFVVTDKGDQGLKVYQSWSALTEDDGSEVGYYSSSIDYYYAGKYNEASLKLLTAKELRTKQRSELVLMRNEIFARYGYQFKADGAMDNYFSSQKWYAAHHKNVDGFLTWLEKENIALLKNEEPNTLDEDIEIGLKEFPKEWHGLTEQENGDYVILKPCLAYNKAFTLEQYPNGKWYIDMATAFDSERYDIVDFELTGNPIYEQYQGHFSIKNVDPEGGEPVVHPFVWNKLQKHALFEKFYGETVRMVSDRNKAHYKTVQEPCDEDEHY